MTRYRVYFLQHGAKIETGVDLDCDSDREALDRASQWETVGKHAEIWSGTRCLGRVEGKMHGSRMLSDEKRGLHQKNHVDGYIEKQSETLERVALARVGAGKSKVDPVNH